VTEAALPGLHRGAAVFVLPTVKQDCYGRHFAISELLGLSVLEAMASGTPVVAGRLDALPEVLRHGETGFLVTPGDVDELRDRVAQLLGTGRLPGEWGGVAGRWSSSSSPGRPARGAAWRPTKSCSHLALTAARCNPRTPPGTPRRARRA
jgi:glycosyltransferase involved in cell wall biosynthesis